MEGTEEEKGRGGLGQQGLGRATGRWGSRTAGGETVRRWRQRTPTRGTAWPPGEALGELGTGLRSRRASGALGGAGAPRTEGECDTVTATGGGGGGRGPGWS